MIKNQKLQVLNTEEEVFVEKEEVAPMSFEIKDVEAQEDDPVVHLLELDEMMELIFQKK